MSSETIYALSTVYGKSGIAIIRISGKDALKILSEISSLKSDKIIPRRCYYTQIKDKKSKEILDKCVVVFYKGPNSFTGEDIVEINCHGSKAVLNSVFKCLSQFKEMRLAEPGEFTKRAFYNKKMDLTEAEGLADLIDAETFEQQKFALRQMDGNLKELYSTWRNSLVKVLSILEAFIDFPDEEIPDNLTDDILNTVFKVQNEIKKHLADNDVMERLKNGFNIVLAGQTNAGKSSLINILTKKNTVIVSDIAGTTRDAIDINLDIKGYPVVITDTAGLRDTDDKIEKMGIDITYQKMNEADIILGLYDASQDYVPIGDKNIQNKIIYIANKIDLIDENKKNKILANKHILISAKFNIGIDFIIDKILKIIKNKINPSSNTLITRTRYKQSLEECLQYLSIFNLNKEIELAAEDIRLACRSIGKITGEVAVSEVLNNIFSSFCIGK